MDVAIEFIIAIVAVCIVCAVMDKSFDKNHPDAKYRPTLFAGMPDAPARFGMLVRFCFTGAFVGISKMPMLFRGKELSCNSHSWL